MKKRSAPEKRGSLFMENKIKTIYEECRAEQRSVGIPCPENITTIKINSRAKSRFGSCRVVKSLGRIKYYEIELSAELFKSCDKDIKAVLHHEMIHTCRGCMNHGARWKEYAARLNARYGYNIQRTTSYESLGLERPEKKENVKYIIVCENCGMKIERKRKCRLVTETNNYRCGKCGGKLKLR